MAFETSLRAGAMEEGAHDRSRGHRLQNCQTSAWQGGDGEVGTHSPPVSSLISTAVSQSTGSWGWRCSQKSSSWSTELWEKGAHGVWQAEGTASTADIVSSKQGDSGWDKGGGEEWTEVGGFRDI